MNRLKATLVGMLAFIAFIPILFVLCFTRPRAVWKQTKRLGRAVGTVLAILIEWNLNWLGAIKYVNTITNLIPILYEAMDVVSRELVGFVPAVSRDSSPERAALNQTINIYAVPAIATANITPGVTAPNDGDQTIGNITMTISKSKYAPVRWNGEEQKTIGQTGVGSNVVRDQFTQAMRALVNEVEADLAKLYINASRAFGTAGAAPYGTAGDLSDAAQIRKILEDNGAPQSDLQVVLGTSAMANIRGKQSVLFKVNEAGTDQLLRQGTIGILEGMALHTSGQVQKSVAGTGTAYTSTAAGFAVGTTSIPLITGSGTVVAGDVVTFAGDTNKYVVTTGVAAPGTIVIGAPGLMQAIPAVATAMTIGAAATMNMGFSKSAMHLVTRAPAMPDGGDMADDIMELTDPVSGLAFQIAVYRQYRQVRYEVGLAWGVKLSKPEHVALNIG